MTVSTSAILDKAQIVRFINGATNALSQAAKVPKEHVHIHLNHGQIMTWGGRLGGEDGAPHTAQIRILCLQDLAKEVKLAIITGVLESLPGVPKASTQFYFEGCNDDQIAIDGLLLPDLIARD
eukprot:CAMPEP_0198139242 /NCGR_PEP_ID=MMETSP1443-20131203/2591_1 /TAXON_ID=186043 /ORGANISM="Entomoneis sp., Strain CCMP2396" /LENGTH=122 /DNA_ID=CAMNT_0043801319 /DNA_START=204 /DNA_END=572 /DNA_ORIENTATION=-